MRVFTDGVKVPIKSWCMKPEESALQQARNLANLPFVHRWVALMPDTHCGFGMPIGGVVGTKDVILPNAVGSDIGCGMCAVKSNIQAYDRELLTQVMTEMRYEIPVGFGRHLTPKAVEKLPPSNNPKAFYEQFLEPSLYQLGTLGGGNHFIELQKDKDGFLWVMIHSGSRNLGKQVADHFNQKAVELNARWFSAVPAEWELAFLPVDSQEGQDYMENMQYCVDFALANRMEMMRACQAAIYKVFKPNQVVEFTDFVNIPHNYARLENHAGENVWVHRKGATSAKDGEVGIIPGSQGTASYIVRGKGNKESFQSCSHGAGRTMGRKEAQRTLDLAKEQAALEAQGIIHSVRDVKSLDEAPSSYKPIDVVMEEQKDLVDILVELKPLAVIKG